MLSEDANGAVITGRYHNGVFEIAVPKITLARVVRRESLRK